VKEKLVIAGVLVVTVLAGALCAEFIYRSNSCRNAFGVFLGRGRLLALVERAGIYQTDLEKAIQEAASRGADLEESDSQLDRSVVLSELVANARVEDLARHAAVSRTAVDQEYNLLAYQLRPEQQWLAALHANRFSTRSLHHQLARRLQSLSWIEQRLATQIESSTEECLQYYQGHLEAYWQPVRFRASHLFLAAPPGTAAEVVAAKASLIQKSSDSIAQGAKFADIVSGSSEDEASKTRGGDLNYFSDARMPSDFHTTIIMLTVDELSPVIRTQLGFHIVQLTDIKPAANVTFEQSEPEIRLILGNLKRRAATSALQAALCREAEFMTTPPL
jgi:parvulin-like peptidyl-prolyl isomerase